MYALLYICTYICACAHSTYCNAPRQWKTFVLEKTITKKETNKHPGNYNRSEFGRNRDKNLKKPRQEPEETETRTGRNRDKKPRQEPEETETRTGRNRDKNRKKPRQEPEETKTRTGRNRDKNRKKPRQERTKASQC